MESVQSANHLDASAHAKPRLSQEAVAALHAALDSTVAGQFPAWSAALQDALERICNDARRNDWSPESLVIAFTSALDTVPSVQQLPRGPARDRFVARLVSLCFDAYYGNSR